MFGPNSQEDDILIGGEVFKKLISIKNLQGY